jgi:hypothetical protein
MRLAPRLKNDFIVNEEEYQQCKAWLFEATAQTIRHPLEDPELEIQRRRIKGLVNEYESNWRERS